MLQLKSLGKLSIGFYFNVNFQLICYLPVNVSFPLFLSTERLLLFWHFVKSVISLLRWNFTLLVCVIYCLVCLVCLLDYSIAFGFKCYFAVYGKKNFTFEYWITDSNFTLQYLQRVILITLPEKCPYSELFWSVFSCVRTTYGQIRSMREYKDQNNLHFSRSAKYWGTHFSSISLVSVVMSLNVESQNTIFLKSSASALLCTKIALSIIDAQYTDCFLEVKQWSF